MSQTGDESTRTSTDPALLAPHVDPSWVSAFVVEQRLLGVPGARIGDGLATVDAHCAESGESAGEAFGDPTAYARDLAGEADEGEPWRPGASGLIEGLASLTALMATPVAVTSLLGGGQERVTLGHVVIAGLAVAALGALLLRPTPIVRWFLQGSAWVRGAVAALVPVTVFVAVLLVLDQEVATIGWLPLVAVVVAGNVVAVALQWRGRQGDPLRDPRTGASATASPWVTWLTVLLVPLTTVGLAVMTWGLWRG